MEQDELFGGVEMAQNVASRGCFPRRKKTLWTDEAAGHRIPEGDRVDDRKSREGKNRGGCPGKGWPVVGSREAIRATY